MTALVRYQGALLLRSLRWLPPLAVFTVFVAVGVQTGGPILDGFGYVAAGLLPLTVWLVRVCVTGEPAASRDCVAAAGGPRRAHLAAVLTAAGAGALPALAGTAFVALTSDARSSDHRVPVPVPQAALAGLVTALACLLLGVAVGVLTNRPVLRGRGWDLLAGSLAALLLLVLGSSPANAAVSDMVTGSARGAVTVPWLPLGAAALAAVVAVAVACLISYRRD